MPAENPLAKRTLAKRKDVKPRAGDANAWYTLMRFAIVEPLQWVIRPFAFIVPRFFVPRAA